jgi:hypothetical protein
LCYIREWSSDRRQVRDGLRCLGARRFVLPAQRESKTRRPMLDARFRGHDRRSFVIGWNEFRPGQSMACEIVRFARRNVSNTFANFGFRPSSKRNGRVGLLPSPQQSRALRRKKLRKSALKSRKSLARVNLCAASASGPSARPSLGWASRLSPDPNPPLETARAQKSRRICAPHSPRETSPPKAWPPPLPSARAKARPASS